MIQLAYNKTLASIIDVAQIHASRLNYALKKLAPHFPLSTKAVLAMTEDEYPNQPDVTAQYLNKAFELCQILLDDLDNIVQFAKRKKLIADQK